MKLKFDFSPSAPPTPKGRISIQRELNQSKSKARDDSECFISISNHNAISDDGFLNHRKNPTRSHCVACSRCEKEAIIWCVDCSVHLCENHDRQRHSQSMFSRYHKRGYNLNTESNKNDNSNCESFPTEETIVRNSKFNDAEMEHQSDEKNEKDDEKKKRRKSNDTNVVRGIRRSYKNIVMAIIRPPRFLYSNIDLGSRAISVGGGLIMHRNDFTIKNRHDFDLQCSLWKPSFIDSTSKVPCVIYLHGNSSARTDVVRTRALLPLSTLGCTVLSFDFSGSGLSGGEYVTLGGNELHDVNSVITYMKENKLASKFTIWGRSMGAASALLYCSHYGTDCVNGLVLDSPFSSFRALCVDIVSMGGFRVPKFAVRTAISIIRRSVKKKTKIDIRALKPLKGVSKISCPALFISAFDDNVVPPHHSERLSQKYKGPHFHIKCKGRHNTARPEIVLECITAFIKASFRWPDQPINQVLESIQRSIEEDEISELRLAQSNESSRKPKAISRIQHKMTLKSSSHSKRQDSGRGGLPPLQPHSFKMSSSSHLRTRSRGSFLDDVEEDDFEPEDNFRRSTSDFECVNRIERVSSPWEIIGLAKETSAFNTATKSIDAENISGVEN